MRKKCWALILIVLFWMIGKPQAEARIIKVPWDYTRIQDAIAAAAFGDEVIVDPGTYYEYLALKPGVAVRAKGTKEERKNHVTSRRTVIDANGENWATVVEGADFAAIDGFGLTGLGILDHHTPGHAHGIQCRGHSAIIINNEIYRMGSTGIGNHVKGKLRSMSYIANNIVYDNNGLGIGCNHNSSPSIIGNTIYNNRDVGIGCKNGAHPLVEMNLIYSNGTSGVGAKDGAYPVILSNRIHDNGKRRIAANGAGIGADNTIVPLIENNNVSSNYLAGIGIRRQSVTTIRNNETSFNRFAGIGLDNVKFALIEGNLIRENNKGGIGITNNSSAYITKNIITKNINAAISPRSKGKVTIAKDNEIRDNGVPFKAEPPAFTKAGYNPLSGERTSDKPPPGLPDPTFFNWVSPKAK
ncbi:MAG: right-handed parallel beta-helix repeat-containing protein [bacterium]